MHVQDFTEAMELWNDSMSESGRQIMLILDQATPHTALQIGQHLELHGLKTRRLSNLLMVLLPAGNTEVLQPMDNGIITAFQRRFQQRMLQWYEMRYLQPAPPATDAVPAHTDHTAAAGHGAPHPSLADAATWVIAAWSAIPAEVMQMAWAAVRLLPSKWKLHTSPVVVEEEERINRENRSLRQRLRTPDQPEDAGTTSKQSVTALSADASAPATTIVPETNRSADGQLEVAKGDRTALPQKVLSKEVCSCLLMLHTAL